MTAPAATPARPGWPELVVGLLTYAVMVIGIGVAMFAIPTEQAMLRGIFGMAANGIAGGLALLAAWAIRLRDFRAFGFRSTTREWLLTGAALGVVGYGLSFLIEGIYFSFMPPETTQDDFVAAASGGLLPFITILVTGALFTPFGEEVVFRGVIANALGRYGAFVAIVVSAAIFGIMHGLNVILLDAFMIGLLTGWVFWRTGSLYPALAVHVVYNGLHLMTYSTFGPA